jgi:Ni,Fe-hydrogenase I cytochrome b subunit
MMILGLSLGLTGYLMTTGGDKDFFKEIHELCANLFLITAIAHVAGIVLHTILHRDPIGLSMLHGKKKSVGNQPAIAKTYFGVGLIFLTILTAFVFYLYTNYNSKNQTLNFLGKNLELGESEEHSND